MFFALHLTFQRGWKGFVDEPKLSEKKTYYNLYGIAFLPIYCVYKIPCTQSSSFPYHVSVGNFTLDTTDVKLSIPY